MLGDEKVSSSTEGDGLIRLVGNRTARGLPLPEDIFGDLQWQCYMQTEYLSNVSGIENCRSGHTLTYVPTKLPPLSHVVLVSKLSLIKADSYTSSH